MSTAIFYILVLICLLTFVVGTLLILSLALNHMRSLIRYARSQPANVICPHTGRLTQVRLGFKGPLGESRLTVTCCERFETEDLHCDADCLSILPATALYRRKADGGAVA